MKKPILLCLSLSLAFLTSFSQTKEETEQWILSKLKTYIAPHDVTFYNSYQMADGGYTEKDYAFTISNGKLLFSYTDRTVKLPSVDAVNRNADVKEVKKNVTIPLYAIKEIKKGNGKTVLIGKEFKSADEIIIFTDSQKISVEEEGSFTYKKSAITIVLVNEEENDLPQRLQKAFTHLKTFYSAPVNSGVKEAF